MAVMLRSYRRRLASVVWGVLLSAALPLCAQADDRGFLGMQVQGMSPKIADALGLKTSMGVIVRDISVDGPAAHAGIARGDIITKMNDTAIDTFDRLLQLSGDFKAGDKVAVELFRSGAKRTVQMTLGDWPPQWKVEDSAFAALPELGLTFGALTPKLRDRMGIRWSSTGIVVTVVDNAFSTNSALQRGDIVVQINQKIVWEPSQFLDAYAKAKGDGRNSLILLIERSDGFKYVVQPVAVKEVEAPVFKIPGQGG